MKQIKLTLLFCATCISFITAQNFTNPDLNGTISGPSSLPTGWQNVPYTDVTCQATSLGQDSPDLTSLTAPDAVNGIIGNPYTGSTFVSGLHADVAPTVIWQEGIMQTVSGFNIGQMYTIYFHQAVVKQTNALDTKGSWAVYIDNTLADITPPTHSSATYTSTSFIWENESVSFTATATSHVIKFLPYDDDPSIASSTTDTTGALRMGIDNINMDLSVGLDEIDNSVFSNVFPNPFNQSTRIQFDNSKKENCTLTLYNYSGKVVRTINNISSDKIILEKNDLPNGLYFFAVETTDRIIIKGKVTVN